MITRVSHKGGEEFTLKGLNWWREMIIGTIVESIILRWRFSFVLYRAMMTLFTQNSNKLCHVITFLKGRNIVRLKNDAIDPRQLERGKRHDPLMELPTKDLVIGSWREENIEAKCEVSWSPSKGVNMHHPRNNLSKGLTL